FEEAWEAALVAETIFQGGLLPGFEAGWIDEHRSHLEELHLRALETVARAGTDLGDLRLGKAERAARSAVEASPFRESARAALIEVLARQGNVAEAVRSYEELRVLLRDELGTYPAPELNDLHERLLKAHESPRPESAEPARTGTLRTGDNGAPSPGGAKAIARTIDPRIATGGTVGRNEVLRRLHDELDRAVAGDLRVALLAGEGGVGKTRVAAELAASREDVTALYGRCDPDEVRPFRVWSGLLRTALGQGRQVDPAEVVGADGPTLARLLPELVGRMGLPAPGPTSDLESERRALFGAVVRMIGRLTATRPMLIILDDLQWADRSTLRLLASLAGDDPLRGVLAIGIYRDTEIPPDSFLPETLADLQRHRPTLRLEIDALPADDVRTLIGDRVDGDLVSQIHDQTGGNPFFIEQMVRHLEETGETDASRVPGEIREVIRQRVARLGEGGPGLLSRAAVIGRDFDLGVLMKTTTLDEDEAIDRLDEAVTAGLLDESSTVPGRYSFVHELLRSTLENDLGLTRRSTIHRDIGKVLEQRNRSLPESRRDRELATLAWHFSLAGPSEIDRAIRYSARAAEQAESRLAFDEAVEFYDGAIAACRADEPVDYGLLSELLINRAEAEWRMGRLPQSGVTFVEATGAARKSGLPEPFARAANGVSWGSWETFDNVRDTPISLLTEALELLPRGDGPLRAETMANLSHLKFFSGDPDDDATGMSREALAMAERLGDETFLTVVVSLHYYLLQSTSQEYRREAADRAVRIAEESDDSEDLGEALALRAVIRTNAGRGAEAAVDIARHSALSATLPQIRSTNYSLRASRCFLEGRWAEGERISRECLSGVHLTSTARIAVLDAMHYMDYAHRGRLGEAVDVIRAEAEVARSWNSWPAWEAGLALSHHQAGDDVRARELLDEIDFDRIGSITRMGLLKPVFCGVATMLIVELGDVEKARIVDGLMDSMDDLWTIFGPGAPTFGPRSLLRGELCLVQERSRDAATALENAVVTCETMGARPFLARAQTGLAEALTLLGHPDGEERSVSLRQSGVAIAHELDMKPLLRRIDPD
ncbi:MAG: AAA family ATPase, partial [Actinomycetota bacterium]|nr:AAA family ATPase [Actinomycetota bacterium]